MHSFLTALAFLTVLPVRWRELPSAAVIARSRFWYPVVGLLLGALLGGGTALAVAFTSPLLGGFLVLLAWVGLTGALHLDGFCDLCDGLFGGHTAEDRLRILKDPHLGTFGLAGGVLLLLGKLVALHELITRAPALAPWLVGGAVVLARCLVLVMAAGARYPRSEGTGKLLIEATRPWEGHMAACLAVGMSVAACPGIAAWKTMLLSVPSYLAVLALRWLCERRLGGITGDCLGAAIELAEGAFLLAAALHSMPGSAGLFPAA